MTKEEIARLLFHYQVLALVAKTLWREPEPQESAWYVLAQVCECQRPLHEILRAVDPMEDPAVSLQAIQAQEAMDEDRIWIGRIAQGLVVPYEGRWN